MARKTLKPLNLSRADHAEIAASLYVRLSQLSNAKANSPQHRRWRQHVVRIIRAIGKDGQLAAAQGISPATR